MKKNGTADIDQLRAEELKKSYNSHAERSPISSEQASDMYQVIKRAMREAIILKKSR